MRILKVEEYAMLFETELDDETKMHLSEFVDENRELLKTLAKM